MVHNYSMKELKDYKEEIYKCSKCGLCQAVCPVYEVTKNECAVSRGKFILLNGIMQNELKLNKSIIQNIDLCINCNACKEFCPSDINAKEIFASARYEFNKTKKRIKIFNSIDLFEIKLKFLKILISVYKLLILDKLFSHTANKFPSKNGLLNNIKFLNSITEVKSSRKKQLETKKIQGKVLFFESCFTKYINPSSKNASINLLEKLGYEVTIIKNDCCGIKEYYAGNFVDFEKKAKKNYNKLTVDCDYIVSDCDSCICALRLYDDVDQKEINISNKVVTMSKLLLQNNYKTNTNKESITYQKPCNYAGDHIELLKKQKNSQLLIEEDQLANCPTTFNNRIEKYTKKLATKTIQKFIESDTKKIITTCPTTLLRLKKELLDNNCNIEAMNLTELLDAE